MNEIRLGVVSDAAAVKRQGGITQRGGLRSRQANVDGLGLHVQAVLGNARRMRT